MPHATQMREPGNLSNSMRENYSMGVDKYYQIVSESYRNPHYEGVCKVLNEFLTLWWKREGAGMEGRAMRVMDLAAGSGEATEAILNWHRSHLPSSSSTTSSTPTRNSSVLRRPGPAPPPSPLDALRRPPPPASSPSTTHRPAFLPPRPSSSLTLPPSTPPPEITALDPYTSPAYTLRTERPCLALSFQDVAEGALPEGEDWDIVVVSFALHLVESNSALWALLGELSRRARWLVVVAPHKKPEIKEGWGWRRWELSQWADARGEDRGEVEIVRERVRLRVWKSAEIGD